MCGITGYISRKNHGQNVIERMTDRIRHRGPDASGTATLSDNGYNIVLGHRRLSILDLSDAGKQPMEFEQLVVSFNGEIYNHLEIRNDLEAEGYSFSSTSDTETLLKAYHRWGHSCLERFNGMFAFAVYDKKRSELFLARDRIGIKPLYYYVKNGVLIFGSELKPLMLHPEFSKDIDTDALNSFFSRRYITKPNSIFKNTQKLAPGNYLYWRNGSVETNAYWSIREKFSQRQINPNRSEKDYLDEFDSLLQQSVNRRLLSDVPIGAFLSGGHDSSLTTGVMQSLSSNPISTFSIGFDEPGYNEAVYAKEVAKFLGTQHHELYFTADRLVELVPQLPEFYDEPFSDASQLPTMLLSEFTKQHVTVSLSGDGGDELFCGYSHYEEDLKNLKVQGVGRLLAPLKKSSWIRASLDKLDRRLLKFLYFQNKDSIINAHFDYPSDQYFDGLVKGNRTGPAFEFYDGLDLTNNIQEKHMLQDMMNWLPEDILTKVDRASMAYALEARVPLLDHTIVEFSFSVPHHLKYNNGVPKYLLKQLAHRYVPQSLLDRPKTGFMCPIEAWLRTSLKSLVDQYLSEEYLTKQDIFNVGKTRTLLKRSQNESGRYFSWFIWSLLMFQLWHGKYID